MQGPAIFVVATPIGNLDDLSPRALAILKSAQLIAAEDTRHTLKLLSHFGIGRKEMVSYHDHGEEARARSLLERIRRDELTLALVSDAGTPCIADPGYRLVSQARALGVPVHPIPGPSALTALVSASGLPSDRFLFVGFLPTKKQALRTELESWSGLRASIVFYESPRRLVETLASIAERYPGARVAVGRELTKLHEELVVLDVAAALAWAETHSAMRGEAVVMVDLSQVQIGMAAPELEAHIRVEAAQLFADGATLRDALTLFRDRGIARPLLYQWLLEVKNVQDRTDD